MKRSKHSLSHYKLLTGKMANLIPCGLLEVLPGDTFQHATSLLVRCAPLNAPVMHPLIVRLHHWFVPTRLLWTNFTSFITGGISGSDASVFPTITINPSQSSLADYFGLPPGTSITVSALPFRAYALIYNNFYADEDLVSQLGFTAADGADATTNTALQPVAWEKDFYTTSRPWTQKGSAVTLPLGTKATVRTNSTGDLVTGAASGMTYRNTAGSALPSSHLGADVNSVAARDTVAFTAQENIYPANLYADLSTATAATINQIRHAFALQRYEEARGLYGARFTEYLRYLGIRSSDARLQLPEYLGGGKQTIQFSEVLQTAVTTSGTPTTGVGSLLGHGIGAVRSNRYRRFFEEHGFVLSLLSVLPKTMYSSGAKKMWWYSTKEDFWQKELEPIGQQAILNEEVYTAQAGGGGLTGVFGYQDRYDQYRREESSISGLFRTTLNTWHLGRIFAGDVTLNSTFVQANPSSRIFQDTSSDHLYVMANHSVQARRLVSSKGVPGMRVL